MELPSSPQEAEAAMLCVCVCVCVCVGGGHPSGADQPPLGQSHLTAWN